MSATVERNSTQEECRLTSWLLVSRSSALADFAGFLQVNVPVLLLALVILDSEREDGAALFDGIFALGIVG